MCHAEKRAKQETQISSAKRKHLALDGESKRDESRQEELFYEIVTEGATMEKENDNRAEIKTCSNSEKQNINWKHEFCDTHEERDTRCNENANFEKAREAEI